MHDALIKFVEAEVAAEEREVIAMHRNTVSWRVENGCCITGLKFEGVAESGLFVYSYKDNKSKYRAGDLLVINTCKLRGDAVLQEGVLVWLEEIDHFAKLIRLERANFIDPPCSDDCTVDKGFFDYNSPRLKHGIELGYDRADIVALLEGRARLVPANAFAASAIENGEISQISNYANSHDRQQLTERQCQALASAISANTTLIQGPPGSGKTFLLALIVADALARGHSVLVTAPTHKAIDNLITAVARKYTGDAPIVKIVGMGRRPNLPPTILQTTADDPFVAVLEAPFLVGATIYQAYKLHQIERLHFDLAVIDEAGQMPIAHCMPALLNANRYVIAGDHKQLPPVLKDAGAHPEFLKRSLYEHLHDLYPHAAITLDVTFRMNNGINEFPSQAFYANVLRPSQCAAQRRFQAKETDLGELTNIICRDECVTFVELEHRRAIQRAPLEADLVARLAAELVLHHALAPQELAIVSPHRAHNEEIRAQLIAALGHDPRLQARVRDRLVVDTVERLQGQERDVIIFSLCASDRQYAINKSQFLYSPNRLNVAITRSRTRLFVVGSKYFFPHINGILIDAGHLQLWESYYEYLVSNGSRVVHKTGQRTDQRSVGL